MRKRKKWSQEEDVILIENYSILTKKELLSLLPNRTAYAINIRASNFKLKKNRNEYCESDCSVLLNESPESYYWAGFIAADGHISDLFRLTINISLLDKQHLIKFSNYIKCPNTSYKQNMTQISISCQDRFYLKHFKEKFNLTSNKTYNPPNLDFLTGNSFLAFFIGFIDGDGCIKYQTGRKDCSLDVHIHASWLHVMNTFCLKLEQILQITLPKPKIMNDGYLKWTITNSAYLRLLKNTTKQLSLPVLIRKWDMINENYISRAEKVRLILPKIKELYLQGHTAVSIAQQTNRTTGSIYSILKRYKHEFV